MSVQLAPHANFPTVSPVLDELFDDFPSHSFRTQTTARQLLNRYPSIRTSYDFLTQVMKSKTGYDLEDLPFTRERVKEAEMCLIQEISDRFLRFQKKIVEIGAGKLNEDGHSYLMERLPQNVRDTVEPTEVNRAHINPSGKKLKHVDTLELSKSYAAISLERIICSAFLDTLNESDLIQTLQQAHAVLKENGLLIHISTLEPYRDTLLSENTDEQTIFFPWANDKNEFQGLQVISKEELIKFLDTAQNIPDRAIGFLRSFASLSAFAREILINHLNEKAIDQRLALSNWISEIKPEGLRYVDNFASFENRTKRCLEKTGFKILEFGYRSKSHIIKRPKNFPDDRHRFTLEPGRANVEDAPLKKKDHIFQSVKMHVIIAMKTSTNEKV